MSYPNIILASSSPYRRKLLEKLQIPFSFLSPDIDETPKPNETPTSLVTRLAFDKAKKVQSQVDPTNIIIASDQVVSFENKILGKPLTKKKAIKQLSQFSNQKVTFYTSLCVLSAKAPHEQVSVEPFYVHFKTLSIEQITQYIDKESPLNCAGSFKSEGLGIALFDKLEGEDPNTLIGLPLIRLCQFLKTLNVHVL
ncbi:Maf family nucleotide pyrophosphatase [Thiotrichales bacterium 19S11-10]|nr:Maf family nucleotide pyrophosphatase [Thiotrichales bacterium 19S11-10]